MIVQRKTLRARTNPFVLDEALVDPSFAGWDVLAELLAVGLAREVQGPVQVEVIRLKTTMEQVRLRSFRVAKWPKSRKSEGAFNPGTSATKNFWIRRYQPCT